MSAATTMREGLRGELAWLHGREAESLPSVAYASDGPYWAEWLLEAMPVPGHALTVDDMHFLLAMLSSDIRSQILAGNLPSPELRATMLIWKHGPDNALMVFVQPAWDKGECPDDNIAWLLLHPDRIPDNFCMFRKAHL
jgi:hypothetical protein